MRLIIIALLVLNWAGIAHGQTKLPETIRTPELTATGSGGNATPPALAPVVRDEPKREPVKLPETIKTPELTATGTGESRGVSR